MQRHDRSRTSVVGIALVAAFGVEHPDPSRQLRWHIQHRLARGDELLGHQRPRAGRALDRPAARLEARREPQQPVALRTVGVDSNLADDLLATVEHRHGV